MVRVTAMLAGVALAAVSASASSASANSFDALPAFAIPSFDYPTIGAAGAPERLLQELQSNGIVALRNVPNYANARAQYLQKAVECAVVASEDVENGSFVSQKQFPDGTKRFTISTNAGLELAGSAAKTQAKCPGYQALYEEFSEILERTVNTFGSTLDATSFRASDGASAITSRKLVSEAIRLDHFHAYQAAAADASGTASSAQQHRELAFSLPLHEDHGLFIAMSAPKFFEVQQDGAGRRLVERELAADRSGLVIQTADGQRVRPVLNEDEVVIMMGTGASRWLQTSHQLPAVLHGMKMPESMAGDSSHRTLRAWFGKMTLLPAYQRMLQNQNVVFDSVVNSTTRYLLQKSDDAELMTIGCAAERRLDPSEGSCTLRTCSTKAGGSAPSEGCATICNRVGHSDTDEKECAEKCTCSDAGSAERCWMLCVPTLPTNQCAKSDQTCTGQKITCTKPISAPAPAPAPAPATTPAPAPTPAPATSRPPPATQAPGTPSSNSPPAGSPSSPSPAAGPPTPGSSPTTPSGASATPKPATPSGSDTPTGAGSQANSSSTVAAPSPTTAAPTGAAALPSAALLVTSLAALAHALFQ